MANYNATARSNWFKVKPTFDAWVESIPDIDVQIRDGFVAIFGADCDTRCFPSQRLVEDKTGDVDYEDIYLAEELAPHLEDGEIAVLMEAGAEKQRYIGGWAIAVHSDGRVVSINLNDIYGLAEKEFGKRPTPAEY